MKGRGERGEEKREEGERVGREKGGGREERSVEGGTGSAILVLQ